MTASQELLDELREVFLSLPKDRDPETGCLRPAARCWLAGYKKRGLYLKHKGVVYSVRRLAWYAEHGDLPRLPLAFTCDNSWCCAIEHLKTTNAAERALAALRLKRRAGRAQ